MSTLIVNATRTVLLDIIPEKTTPTIRFQIVDRDGVGFKPEDLWLTLFNYQDDSIINYRAFMPVLDANGVTTDANGNTEWVLSFRDTPIVLPDDARMRDASRNNPTSALVHKGVETHIAMFEWRWNGGASYGNHEIEHRIQARVKIPATLLEAAFEGDGSGDLNSVGDTA